MATKTLPFSIDSLRAIATTHPTPFHIYDEQAIRRFARELRSTFLAEGCTGYRNYFAVKALPNPSIMQILLEEGMGFDCSSKAELLLCERIGAHNECFPNGLPRIMFTSNNTPADEFAKAVELGAIVNLDDLSHVEYFAREIGEFPGLMCFRYNPGPLRSFNDSHDFIIGNPAEAKFGLTRDQLFAGYAKLRDAGVTRFGLHTMVVSNERHTDAFAETAGMLFELVAELSQQLEIQFDFVNLGGGFGVAYRPEEPDIDLTAVSAVIRKAQLPHPEAKEVTIVTENGRRVTGPYGYLVTEVRHTKEIYRDYLCVDATMANLMRPGMYGAYHHITAPGKPAQPTNVYDVVGSLCENNDKFAIQRELPVCQPGDLLVLHDAGAHGHAMGFNYNGKLRSAELLLHADGNVQLIRRAETYDDLFSTLDY